MHNYVVSSIYAATERDWVVLNVPRLKQKGETKAQELSWPASYPGPVKKAGSGYQEP